MARGLDARAVRAGARDVVAALMAAKAPRDFAPALGAAVAVGLARERGVRALVMMPYADRLGRFSATGSRSCGRESLGKNGQGTAPISCLGPRRPAQPAAAVHGRAARVPDQRRARAAAGLGPSLSRGAGRHRRPRLSGRQDGGRPGGGAGAWPCREALRRAGRPVRTFDLARLDERCVGALMMHFVLETILAARLMGVDPFDQPAVELAKVITRERVAALR